MNLVEHAKREFLALGYDTQEEGPDKWIQTNVLQLLETFSNQEHSGSSAPFCIGMFSQLASFEPLSPLSGADSEWVDVSEPSGFPLWQNSRCSHVFKEQDGQAYDLEGLIFRKPSGVCFTSRDSRVKIEFPYMPTREFVDVPEDEE